MRPLFLILVSYAYNLFVIDDDSASSYSRSLERACDCSQSNGRLYVVLDILAVETRLQGHNSKLNLDLDTYKKTGPVRGAAPLGLIAGFSSRV